VGSPVIINQELTPNDFNDAGSAWEDLGVFTISGNTLVVRLSDAANEYVNADAIRIQRVGELPSPTPEITVLAGSTNIADNSGVFNFGSTPPGTPLTQVFTVRNDGSANLTLA